MMSTHCIFPSFWWYCSWLRHLYSILLHNYYRLLKAWYSFVFLTTIIFERMFKMWRFCFIFGAWSKIQRHG